MKWQGIIYDKEIIIKKFAFLPININGEVRWLEFVKIKGYYYVGQSSGLTRFKNLEFVK
jgi:hypothetical protein